jgi:hypothetical protein
LSGVPPPHSAPPASPGPIGRAAPGPPAGGPPAPPTGGAPPAAGRSRTGLLVVTLIVSALSLVVGLAGVAVAAIALGRSDRAGTLAAEANRSRPAPPAADPLPAPTGPATDPAAGSTPDPAVATSPGDISPTAEFIVAYQDEHLRVQSPECNYSGQAGIDLDEPRVLQGDGGEVGYSDCNPGALHTELSFAEVGGQNATPAECLNNIRTAPAQSPVAPRDGLSLCFLTSQNDAAAQGITQKIVFLTVDSITVDNKKGVLNATLRAWDVPE